jgi:hypothetical protein
MPVRCGPNRWQPVGAGTRARSEHPLATKRTILAALGVAVVLPLVAAAGPPAGASSAPSPKSLAKELLPFSYAKKAGFSEVAEKATTTTKTGVKSCPNWAQEVFQDPANKTGVAAEVVGCTTTKAAAAILKTVHSEARSGSPAPPKQLGSSAIETFGGGSTYAIYWQHGSTVELVALTTNVSATSSSTSTTAVTPPITAAQQKVLSAAALAQNAASG